MNTYADGTDTSTTQPEPTPGYPAGRPPLRRVHDGRMLTGVAAGLADYFGVDVTLIRIAFVVLAFLGAGGIAAYLACLLLIPEEGTDESIASSLLDSFQHGSW